MRLPAPSNSWEAAGVPNGTVLPRSGTVLPRKVRPRPARGGRAGFVGTLVAAVTIAVAAVAPSPNGVLAEHAAVAVPPVAVPATPSGLPSAIEGLAAYVAATSCAPAAKPGVLKLQSLLLKTYPGTSAWAPRPCGADGAGAQSEHYEGRALDWSVSVRNPLAARRAATLISWLLSSDAAGRPYANARRLGIMYIVWNNQIWGSYRAQEGWRAYGRCAAQPQPQYDTGCHRDHVHFSLSWAGAQGRTSYWTRHVAETDYGPCRPADLNWAAPHARPNPVPCRNYPTVRAATGVSAVGGSLVVYSGATIGPGSTGPVVSAVQKALGLRPDGAFGTATASAVSGFRTRHGLAAGARVDAATWRALLADFARPASGTGGGATTKPAPAPAKPAPVAAAGPLKAYSGTVLRYGSRGPAVVAVQRALKVSPTSGWFGPSTLRAVQRFQAAHGIPGTGNVGPLTWRALGG